MRKLDAGVHVVSGTPGRVKDMMEKQKVSEVHTMNFAALPCC
jgi:superfamily II DNA/RNA helicase